MSINLNKYTLRFQKEQFHLEKTFLAEYFIQSLPQLRKAIISLTLVYLMFTISDKLLDPENFYLFASIRWLVLAPFAVILFWSTYRKWFQYLFQPLTSIGLLLGAFTTIMFIVKGSNEIQISYHYSIYIVLISMFALFRIRFIWAAPLGLLVFFGYQYVLYFATDLPYNQTLLILVFQGSFIVLGSIVSYQLEYLTRREFHARFELNTERKDLKQKVLQKTSDIEQNYLDIRLEAREKAKLTERLAKTQRLESIGLLAGGIAHDFNNILTGILGNVTLATHQKNLPPEVHAYFNDISINAKRATELTRQFLEFSKQQSANPSLFNPNDIINSLRVMLISVINININLIINNKNTSKVLVDKGQLERVITNLVVNAGDSMPEGGVLTISTFCNDSSVFITVTDTGEGIPEEIQPRIFDPFFTTKDIGKGTGLGLATSYNIIKQFNGKLTATSELNVGSTFQIELPVYDGQIIAEKKEPSSRIISGDGQTILMVEDDSSVLEIGSQFLQILGYYVIPVNNPKEAIEIFNNVNIDLLFTDIIMPQMNGARLAEILKETDPDLPILYTSGYTSDVLQKHGLENLPISLLPKPYTLKALAESLNLLIGTKSEK